MAFCIGVMAKVDGRERLWGYLGMVPLIEDLTVATKSVQRQDVWFGLLPDLIRCLVLVGLARFPVVGRRRGRLRRSQVWQRPYKTSKKGLPRTKKSKW